METCGSHASTSYGPLETSRAHVIGFVRTFDHGKGIAHANVMLRPADGRASTTGAQSDKHGEFRFGEVLPGRYDVEISRKDCDPVRLKGILIPRANTVFIMASMLQQGQLIVCQ